MDREAVKRALLDYGWDAAERQRIAEVIACLAGIPECQQAAADYDRIRTALRPAIDSAIEPTIDPTMDWSAGDPPARPGDDAQAEPPAGWAALPERPGGVASGNRWRRWLRTGGIAAALLLAVGLGWGLRGSNRTDTTLSVAPPVPRLAFEPQEITQSVAAFQQVTELFDQRAGWMLVAGRAADMGLGRDPAQPEVRVLLLRLAVCQRDGRALSQSDLVIIPGQTAELIVPFEAGQLRYHISTTADAVPRLALWLEMEGTGGTEQTRAALATDLLLRPGPVLSAGEMATTTGSYAVKVAFAEADLAGAS